MKIATSYFYQIRNFKPWMIPVSTALSDPQWYRPPEGKEYYIDKRGVVCGLRYEPLIVQHQGTCECPCASRDELRGCCRTMEEYKSLLLDLDFNKINKAFEFCANKFQKELGFKEEPVIVLMVYETPQNLCSERKALQEVFDCKELIYPIKNQEV